MISPYDLAYDYAMRTNRCIFLTGKAGTGKTTFLRRLRTECAKQTMVVAPTGVAAINADGVTVHSLFQLPPQIFLPTPESRRRLFEEMQMRGQKQMLLQNLELLVIDEVSMVRADLLDAIDAVLRHFRRSPNLPFGGVQVLMIGDLYQLSPVANQQDWDILRTYYTGPYFFQALVFRELRPVYIELDHVYRQSNRQFVDLLNEVRNNRLSPESLQLLNSRYQPDWQPMPGEPYHIVLSTHNHKVDEINVREMKKLTGPELSFDAEVKGTFPESMYPTDTHLTLRQGARVMFIKNDSQPEKRYYNGRLGVVVELKPDRIVVACDKPNGGTERIEVHQETWENIRYTESDADSIEVKQIGSFTHFPLRHAWAVTIHKAQGLTFDHVVIDAADAFAGGQVYVALSRCRSLEGIVLLSKIPEHALTNAPDVLAFTEAQPELTAMQEAFRQSEREYLLRLLMDLFDFRFCHAFLERILRYVRQAASFNQDVTIDYLLRLTNALVEMQTTAEVFQRQLQQILLVPTPDMAFLSARLSAAGGWFDPKMSALLKLLLASPAFTDDKEDATNYEEQINRLYQHLHRQHHLMLRIADQPSVLRYFDIRRRYLAPIPRISARGEEVQTESDNPVLFDKLKMLRYILAKQLLDGKPVYILASTKQLLQISNTLPTTKRELLKISGFGPKKYELWGDRILETVKKYKARL